jgi:hypothetical protein
MTIRSDMHADGAINVERNSATMAARCQPYADAIPVSLAYNGEDHFPPLPLSVWHVRWGTTNLGSWVGNGRSIRTASAGLADLAERMQVQGVDERLGISGHHSSRSTIACSRSIYLEANGWINLLIKNDSRK